MFKKTALLLSLILHSHISLASEIVHYKMINNMEVVLIPNYKTEAVMHMVWYKTGSTQDPIGKTGLAHFVEHILFKSTAHLKEGDFFRIVTENGGLLNASTELDYTYYFELIPAEKLPLMMQLESNRMTKLNLNADEISRERQVIIQERNLRVDNVPEVLLEEQMFASLYLNHPNHRPVVGWRHEMEDLQLEDVRKFYDAYYRPDNAILVISGNIDIEKTKLLAEQYYGKIKNPVSNVSRNKLIETSQSAARKVVMCDARTSNENFRRYYQTPKMDLENLWQDYALELLKQILTGTKYSRFNQELITNLKIASYVQTNYYAIPTSPGIFEINIVPQENIELKLVEKKANILINDLYKFGVTQAELDDAKAVFASNHIYQKESYKDLAKIYGILALHSIPFNHFENLETNVKSVTVTQINEMIKKVFNYNQSVTGLLFNQEKYCVNYEN